jgi:hypothetical protein
MAWSLVKHRDNVITFVLLEAVAAGMMRFRVLKDEVELVIQITI